MTDLDPRLTRRTLLGAGMLFLAGCRSSRHSATPDPDAAALAAARAGEAALVAAYAEGTPDHAAHAAHLQALGGAPASAGRSPTPATAPGYTDVRSSVAVLQDAAGRVHSGSTAAVFASIAASHAVLAAPAP